MALHVIVAKYKDVVGAKDAIAAVKQAGIKLADQAYVLNNGGGDLEFKEGKDAGGGKGFVYGASTVAVAGLLLGPVGWGCGRGWRRGRRARLEGARCRDPSADLERLGRSLTPGQAAAIAVATEGDEDKVSEILFNQGGEVVSVSVTDDLKTALDGVAPQGVTVAEDGSSTETA